MRYIQLQVILAAALLVSSGCTLPSDPGSDQDLSPIHHDGTLRIAALDYQVGDLTDPAVLAKYTRADIVIVQCDQFWGRGSFAGKLDLLRAAKPDLRIVGYFRSKVVRPAWGDRPREDQTYNYDLYQASRPYWCSTTTGDTLQDWPGVAVFDFTNPAARQAMLEVFRHYQTTTDNRFDGIYWDYFNPSLWISPTVTTMDGEPDMDGDGVPHLDDADELQAFRDAQEAWIAEMRAAMGERFIQIANGSRALTDSTFAGLVDGMFYEIFPEVGFTGTEKFRQALDPARFNNLWTARHWPRTLNGGPWLILSFARHVGSYRDENGQWQVVDPGDINRVVALLTDCTAIHYDGSGEHSAGIPDVEFDLGRPLSGVTVDGDRFEREFEHGAVVLQMGTGAYPAPFDYEVMQDDVVIERMQVP